MWNPTPAERIVDQESCLYFMRDMTLDRFLKGLRDVNPQGRAYLLTELLKHARPDDVFSFVTPRELIEAWPEIEIHLGSRWGFWDWLLASWEAQGLVWR